MKLFRIITFFALSISFSRILLGQSTFVNLGFEGPTIVTSSPSGYGFNTGTAKVYGWTEYNGYGDQNFPGGATLIYNNQPLDSPGVALEGTDYFTPAIQGKYSVYILGGDTQGETVGAAIGQTGLIGTSVKSITYWGFSDNALQVTFNGHLLSFNPIDTTSTYTIFGADISSYAGQSGELLFTAPPFTGGGFIDNIQFSSLPIPEPNGLSLFSICIVFYVLRAKKSRLDRMNRIYRIAKRPFNAALNFPQT